MYFYFWLIFAIVILLFEVAAPGLFIFSSFSMAAFATAPISIYLSLFYQLLFFSVFSVVFFFGLRSLFGEKNIEAGRSFSRTNIFALIGKKAVVSKTISENGVGKVRVNGELWSAVSADRSVLNVGEVVVIVKVSGNKLYVAREGR